MCMCGKPTVNGNPGYSWDGNSVSIRQPDPPALQEGDILIHDEPGRCGGTDSHCHHFRVVKRHGRLALLVRHGGGDEQFEHLCNQAVVATVLAAMDSNARYWTLAAMYYMANDAARKSREAVGATWCKAAAEGRIKTRKQRGKNTVKVWIEPAQAAIV